MAITVQKPNVQQHIRDDGNKLYNYMIGLALLEEICTEEEATLFPDPRTIKVKSGNSLIDYLQVKLWFEMEVITKLNCISIQSEDSLNLKFVDIVTHLLWSNYEYGNEQYAQKLMPYVKHKRLFFR